MKSNKNEAELLIQSAQSLKGKFSCFVINPDGSEEQHREQPNLILDKGMNLLGDFSINSLASSYCQVGTGNTPNSKNLTGSTYNQVGNLVTRQTGLDVFVGSDVGERIGFTGGKQGKITGFVSGTEVTVDTSQTVSGEGLRIYNTSRDQLDNWIAATQTSFNPSLRNFYFDASNSDFPVMECRDNWLFNIADVENNTIAEFALSRNSAASTTLWNRVVLDDPVVLGPGQQLAVFYTLYIKSDWTQYNNVNPGIVGWPVEYQTTSIIDQGGDLALITITPDDPSDDHHYLAGDEIIIKDAARERFNITSITSTATEFTVTTSAPHGFVAGGGIIIDGSTPSVYDSTWIVDAVPTTTTFTVLTALNAGTGSAGTVREADPTTWWNGTHTVQSVGTNTITINVTSGIEDAGPGGQITNDGSVTVESKAVPYWPGECYYPTPDNNIGLVNSFILGSADFTSTSLKWALFDEDNLHTSVGGFNETHVPSGGQNLDYHETTCIKEAYISDSFYLIQGGTADVTKVNSDRIRAIRFGESFSGSPPRDGCVYIKFNQPQKKRDTHTLKLRFRNSWTRDLAD